MSQRVPPPTAARHDPARTHYPNTVLVVHPPGAPPFEIDLRQEPEPTLGEALARLGLAAPFAVITACNPFGRAKDDATNRRRTRELAERLTVARLQHVPVDGRSPDGAHIEPGFGVVLPLEEARALAREFEQTAIFWWDGAAFWLVDAWKEGARMRLPG